MTTKPLHKPRGSKPDGDARILTAMCRMRDLGEHISINTVIEATGMSRSGVWNGTRRLEAQGLISHEPGKHGSWVLHVERVADGIR